MHSIKSITIYPYLYERHVSPLLTAILAFCNNHGVPLKWQVIDSNYLANDWCGSFWVAVESEGNQATTFCFDMTDWPDIASPYGLDRCSVYVKRSYSATLINNLPSKLRRKIVPYGFYFACAGTYSDLETWTIFYYWLNTLNSRFVTVIRHGYVLDATKRFIKAVLKLMLNRQSIPDFLPLSHLTSMDGGDYKVFYQARLWDPATHKSFTLKTIEEINQTRIALVTQLRAALGEAYIGGIVPSAYAKKHCPELITPHGSDWASYLNLLSRCKIVVTDTGLHGSIGSKVGEYFGAGRCIVTEAINFVVPQPPEDGKHWFTYTTVEECIKICQNLIDNPVQVDAVCNHARAYYQDYVDPTKTVVDILRTGISRASTEAASNVASTDAAYGKTLT